MARSYVRQSVIFSIAEAGKFTRTSKRAVSKICNKYGAAGELTFEFNVPMDNVVLVQVAHGADHLGKHAPDELRAHGFRAGGCQVEEVSSRTIVQNQQCALFITTKSLELHKGRVID